MSDYLYLAPNRTALEWALRHQDYLTKAAIHGYSPTRARELLEQLHELQVSTGWPSDALATAGELLVVDPDLAAFTAMLNHRTLLARLVTHGGGMSATELTALSKSLLGLAENLGADDE